MCGIVNKRQPDVFCLCAFFCSYLYIAYVYSSGSFTIVHLYVFFNKIVEVIKGRCSVRLKLRSWVLCCQAYIIFCAHAVCVQWG